MTEYQKKTGTELGHDIFIPVAIDAEREVDDIEMLRVTYLAVTTDAPTSIWEIDLPPMARLEGFGALGMLGVIFGAVRRAATPRNDPDRFDLFIEPDDLDAIFSLEESVQLSVQLEDIWLPHSWCMDAPVWPLQTREKRTVERGDVYRLAAPLFRQAYRYASGDITVSQLVDSGWAGGVYSSPLETAAFKAWAESQIDLAKQVFLEDRARLKLDYA